MRRCTFVFGFAFTSLLFAVIAAPAQQGKSYRLPGVDLKPQIIWGSVCEWPDGTGLAFGGQDQKSDDGIAHTRIKVGGDWKNIHEDLRKTNPGQKKAESWQKSAVTVKCYNALVRKIHFNGLATNAERMLL